MDFRGRGGRGFKKRSLAPKETFARLQLAAISSVNRIIDSSILAAGLGWLFIDVLDWLAGGLAASRTDELRS